MGLEQIQNGLHALRVVGGVGGGGFEHHAVHDAWHEVGQAADGAGAAQRTHGGQVGFKAHIDRDGRHEGLG